MYVAIYHRARALYISGISTHTMLLSDSLFLHDLLKVFFYYFFCHSCYTPIGKSPLCPWVWWPHEWGCNWNPRQVEGGGHWTWADSFWHQAHWNRYSHTKVQSLLHRSIRHMEKERQQEVHMGNTPQDTENQTCQHTPSCNSSWTPTNKLTMHYFHLIKFLWTRNIL